LDLAAILLFYHSVTPCFQTDHFKDGKFDFIAKFNRDTLWAMRF